MIRLEPGATIGILGGGQLGRMLSVAAARLGLRTVIYDPDPNAPAADVAWRKVTAAWDDAGALAAFADLADVVTYEFENVPAASLDLIEARAPVRPSRRALAISQDRLDEKTFLNSLGLATAPFADASDQAGLAIALSQIGMPGILKTRRLGYDGKGQASIRSQHDTARAWGAMNGQPAILEGFVNFEREISVIAARNADGAIAAYEPGENVHEGGILRTTTLPAAIPADTATHAIAAARRILEALDYIGVIGVEFFVTRDGLVVNEFAPRVHNSGHWTQDAATPDQFELHIRAIAGWPLPAPRRLCDVVMENLIGDDMARVPDLAAEPGVAVHLYGKTEIRAGRKMGHVNRLGRARS